MVMIDGYKKNIFISPLCTRRDPSHCIALHCLLLGFTYGHDLAHMLVKETHQTEVAGQRAVHVRG